MVRRARRRDEHTLAEWAPDGGPTMDARVSVLQACEHFHANQTGETYHLEGVCVVEFALAILAIVRPMPHRIHVTLGRSPAGKFAGAHVAFVLRGMVSDSIHVLLDGALRRERAGTGIAFVVVVALGAGRAVRMGVAVVGVLLESTLAVEVSVTGLAPRHDDEGRLPAGGLRGRRSCR